MMGRSLAHACTYVQEEGDAPPTPQADAAPTRRTAPSATPGLLLAIAVFAAADVVKAVTASPPKRDEDAPAAAKTVTKSVVKATTAPVKAAPKAAAKPVPRDAPARAAAMLRLSSDKKADKV